jgi:phytoene synthase
MSSGAGEFELTPAERRAVETAARQGDRDRYWTALFAAPAARADLLALYAFNAEVARIPYLVSEPMAGQIRLQWWRDAIDLAAEDSRTGNPVADALALAVRRRGLPKSRLQSVVEAREFDLYTEPMGGVPELKTYLKATAGSMFSLAAQVLGASGADVETAAEFAGLAYGLAGLLRALPAHMARGHRFLPLPALEHWQPGSTPPPDLRRQLSDVRDSARRNLQRFREAQGALPPDARPAFLPLALVEPALAQMDRPDFDPLTVTLEQGPLGRYWRLWTAALRGRI